MGTIPAPRTVRLRRASARRTCDAIKVARHARSRTVAVPPLRHIRAATWIRQQLAPSSSRRCWLSSLRSWGAGSAEAPSHVRAGPPERARAIAAGTRLRAKTPHGSVRLLALPVRMAGYHRCDGPSHRGMRAKNSRELMVRPQCFKSLGKADKSTSFLANERPGADRASMGYRFFAAVARQPNESPGDPIAPYRSAF